jgi:hypothetical protein
MRFYGQDTDRHLWAGDGKCCYGDGKTAIARVAGEEGYYVCIEHLLKNFESHEGARELHVHSLIVEGKEYVLNGYRGLELTERKRP